MASETESAKEAKAAAPEGNKLHNYELVMVVTPELTDEKFESRINSVSQFITSHGGAIDNLDRWGKKRLAYPIKKALEGSYLFFHIKLPPEASRELEANLKISEDILRHLLVRIGD